MENGNGHGKQKRIQKAETDMENGKSFMRNACFFKRSSTSTKAKEQTSCIKRIRSIQKEVTELCPAPVTLLAAKNPSFSVATTVASQFLD